MRVAFNRFMNYWPRRRRAKMTNRFSSLSPACLRARYRSMRYRSLLIIAALCLNCLPLSEQATASLSDADSRYPQFVRPSDSLSDSVHNTSVDLRQSKASQNPPGQDQPIRVKTELIDLRAVVTDKRGQPITDLKKEDFELMENGKPQEVSFFSIVKIPGRGVDKPSENSTSNAAPGAPAGVTRRDEAP